MVNALAHIHACLYRTVEVEDRLHMRARAARYNLCCLPACLPSWSQLQLILCESRLDPISSFPQASGNRAHKSWQLTRGSACAENGVSSESHNHWPFYEKIHHIYLDCRITLKFIRISHTPTRGVRGALALYNCGYIHRGLGSNAGKSLREVYMHFA